MRSKILLAILSVVIFGCSFGAFSVSAQKYKVGDSIRAKGGAQLYIKGEYSKDMKMIIQAQLFKLECNTGDAFRVGAGLEGDYFLPKLASFHGEYSKAYFNLQKMDANDLNLSTNSIKGFSLLEFGGRFHLLDRTGRARHKIVLWSNSSYSMGHTYTTDHYIKAKLPARKILAVRGGFYRTTAPVSTDMNANELKSGVNGAVKTKDGTVLSDVYFTNDHTTGFYIGLSQIVNMSVRTKTNIAETDGSSYFSSFFKEVYADVIIAGTTFDPFLAGGKSYAIDPNTKGSFQTTPMGWRVGKKQVFTRKTINMSFSFEIGDRPGVKGRGLYFGTGWNIAFVR